METVTIYDWAEECARLQSQLDLMAERHNEQMAAAEERFQRCCAKNERLVVALRDLINLCDTDDPYGSDT